LAASQVALEAASRKNDGVGNRDIILNCENSAFDDHLSRTKGVVVACFEDPSLIVVLPEWLLLPARTVVPAPSLVTERLPASRVENVVVPV
jgi:hypothetical protein